MVVRGGGWLCAVVGGIQTALEQHQHSSQTVLKQHPSSTQTALKQPPDNTKHPDSVTQHPNSTQTALSTQTAPKHPSWSNLLSGGGWWGVVEAGGEGGLVGGGWWLASCWLLAAGGWLLVASCWYPKMPKPRPSKVLLFYQFPRFWPHSRFWREACVFQGGKT